MSQKNIEQSAAAEAEFDQPNELVRQNFLH
jgi:hypothetical protein